VGARNAEHITSNRQSFSFELDNDDISAIRAARAMSDWQGDDIYDLERIKNGPHAAIMKYNLNQSSS
jgi:diketogulonate reductase-like aldo/keto reductase